jgi:UDP-2,4-diacetamido-2,4,6-trideoxy-beta-L-altropyranose hydrolase
MKIAIRADGGATIGMGHIMRTLVLAEELAKDNQVFYVCKVEKEIDFSEGGLTGLKLAGNKYYKGIEKVLSQGFKVVYLKEDKVIEALKNVEADLLITDSYDVDEVYFDETKTIFNKTAYIDDLNSIKYNVDFIINQNCGAEGLIYKANQSTVLMTGLKYVMLRKEFRNLKPKKIFSNIGDIMITVGGSDANNLTEKLLEAVSDLKYNFHIIIGPSFHNKNLFIKYKKSNIFFYENADMLSIMSSCDLAISACGSTIYELAACGVPTLGIVLAHNQIFAAREMEKAGTLINLGDYTNLENDILKNKIKQLSNNKELRISMSLKGQKLIDGEGVYRVRDFLTQK